ncbi:MAG: putative lipid II flippase FtsW [Verrucomicrobiota bacterium]|nr:putative lipid II flippase FtsW [Verrucomicrobiota bacterium]
MRYATTILAFCVAGLLALGMVMLYSAGMATGGARYLIMQLVWGGFGLAVCFAATSIDYRILQRFAMPLFIGTLVLLVLVLIPGIGIKLNGARRWFDLGPMNFQPSELAKITLLIAIAAWADEHVKKMREFRYGLLLPGAFIGLTLGLVFLGPDFGTTMLLATVCCILLFVAGTHWKYLIPPMGAGAAAITVAIMNDPLRMKRITAFLHPEQHREDTGFQAYQAMLALGSGGSTGLGLGNGRQKLGFVPEHHTDFIFSVIGEELGVVASLLVVLAFAAIVICGLYIAWHSRDRFGMILGTGITFLIGLQAFINIGVVTSALPNKGLPLPFISYGGSSLVMMLGSVGVLLSIANRAGESPPERAKEREPAHEPQELLPEIL